MQNIFHLTIIDKVHCTEYNGNIQMQTRISRENYNIAETSSRTAIKLLHLHNMHIMQVKLQ